MNGLRPIVDQDDEAAVAALSDEERAELEAWAHEWDIEQQEWKRQRATTRRMLAICLPVAGASVAVLKVWGL
jgi:hypothetical protein